MKYLIKDGPDQTFLYTIEDEEFLLSEVSGHVANGDGIKLPGIILLQVEDRQFWIIDRWLMSVPDGHNVYRLSSDRVPVSDFDGTTVIVAASEFNQESETYSHGAVFATTHEGTRIVAFWSELASLIS